MNLSLPQYAASPASQNNIPVRRDDRALWAVPVIGAAATTVSGFIAIVATAVAGALLTGSISPQAKVNVYLTSHPLLIAACCALVVAATALATFRRRALAALLVVAAAAVPWALGIAFLHELWMLAPAT
jgi:ABC-type transport system involved in multi-copper enzyme maturation permease subunit